MQDFVPGTAPASRYKGKQTSSPGAAPTGDTTSVTNASAAIRRWIEIKTIPPIFITFESQNYRAAELSYTNLVCPSINFFWISTKRTLPCTEPLAGLLCKVVFIFDRNAYIICTGATIAWQNRKKCSDFSALQAEFIGKQKDELGVPATPGLIAGKQDQVGSSSMANCQAP